MDELPRILKKTEAHKTTPLVKWVRENLKFSCMVEIKVAKKLKNIEVVYSTQFKPHQIRNLTGDKYTQKLSDALQQQQPADIIHYYNAEHQVILCFKNFNVIIPAKFYPFDRVRVTGEEALAIGKVI